jgi:tape measure domain-containing protein
MAIGKLLLKLGIDTTNLDKELGKVEKSMTKFGQNMSNLGSTLTQSLTLPIIGVGAAALKSFADMERLQNGLTAIMGSSAAASVELEKLRKVAENPGLALPQVVKASATLQSVGMSADIARETITQFGNATARAGEGAETFDGVIVALGQISAVGKVTQEDLNQIKGRLPEFADVMKNEFGVVTAEAINKMGISAEDFITRSVSALGELERAKGGLGNAFDNLKDNVGASLAELGKVINTSLNVEGVFIALSDKINYLVEGFKKLNPETQGFIVKAALIVAAIGPAIFIVGKLITTFGAMVGTVRLIKSTVVDLAKAMNKAFLSILANPAILGITLAIVAIGAVALYVYDNWEAFAGRFTNIWINIKNSANKGVADFMMAIDKLQKKLGYQLFDVSGLTNYTAEQRIVTKEFKSIGETVDSLSGKLKGLFTAAPKAVEVEEIIKTKTKTPGGGGGGAAASPVAAITAETTGITNMLPTLDLLSTKLNTSTASNERLKDSTLALNDATSKFIPPIPAIVAFKTEIESLGLKMNELGLASVNINSAISSGIGVLANEFEKGIGSFNDFANAVVKGGLSIIKSLIQQGVAAAVSNTLKGPAGTLGPVGVAVAGAAGALASGLFTSLISKIGLPALAQGGLAYAPTMAMVGDNKNARVDPEVIAPLSKLKGMLDGGGSPYILSTRVSGADLIVIMEKARNVNTRIR